MIEQIVIFFRLLIGGLTVVIVTGCAPLGCNDVVMVSRARWGARTPKEINFMQTPVPHLFLHHTAMSECSDFASCSQMMRTIQNLHMDDNGNVYEPCLEMSNKRYVTPPGCIVELVVAQTGWDDIGYNFLIGGDGRVYVGRGWNRVGAHTYGFNRNAIAFSLMGDFTNKVPSDLMLNTTKEMIKCAEDGNRVMPDYKLHGHRDAGCTECPGSAFYALIKTWPHFEGGPLPGYTCRGR